MKKVAYTAKVDASCDSGRTYASSINYTIYYKNDIVYEKSRNIGEMTSMKAEFTGLIELLHKAIELKLPRLVIGIDCKSIVDGMYGRCKVHEDLRELHERVAELMKLHSNIHLKHIPRKQNKRSNDLSIQCRKEGKGREKEFTNKLNKANINKHRSYIPHHRYIMFRCPDCLELKSFEFFPPKTSSKRRSCFHCISLVASR